MKRKPMAIPKPNYWRVAAENVAILFLVLIVTAAFTIGLCYLPEYLEMRDGTYRESIYGIRG